MYILVLWVKLCAMPIWNGIFFDEKLNSWFNASNKIYSCSSDRGYCEITSSRLDFSAEKGITYCCLFFRLAEMLIIIFIWLLVLLFMCLCVWMDGYGFTLLLRFELYLWIEPPFPKEWNDLWAFWALLIQYFAFWFSLTVWVIN